jgi:hypothetical protein
MIPAGASAVVEVGERHGNDEAIDKITLREALANQREAGAARERDAAAAALAAARTIDEVKDARRDVEGFVTTGFTAGALAAARTDGRVAAPCSPPCRR